MPALFRKLCTAALLPAALGTAQAQVAAITLSEPGQAFESASYMLGFAFNVLQDVRLMGLGVYDHGADGLEASAQVGLWLAGLDEPALLADVPGGTAATLDGLFRFAPVAPRLLRAGEVYVVAAYLDGGTATSYATGQGGVAVVDPRILVVADRYGDGFFGLSLPSESDGFEGAWLGANLQLAPVPAPPPAALLAAGLAALGWRMRRLRQPRP